MSLSQAQIQDLLNNPPTAGQADPRFAGRDWQHIAVGELVHPEDLRFVEWDTGVEDATKLLTESGASVLLIRSSPAENSAAATYDYRDLTQYLLFATGQLFPDTDEHRHIFHDLAKKAQTGQKIPLRDAKSLGNKEPFVTLPHHADLTAAVELFGGGVHKIVIVKGAEREAVGVLSQLRLVEFLWENGTSFPVIDQFYGREIRDLGIGSQHVISIKDGPGNSGDKPLKEALTLMNNEGVSSLAVVDNQYNVVGNISNVDLLTKSSSAPLLENTCIHFISVILTTRGMEDGKDSYPVFYVNSTSTLAHTVAKLVATKSHRMWVVDAQTPGSTPHPSAPVSPLPTQITHPSLTTSSSSLSNLPSPSSLAPSASPHNAPVSLAHPPAPHPPHLATNLPQAHPPFLPLAATPSVSASALPGQHMSGRLNGVVSLTDILNLFAKATGLHPEDPEEARRKRRGSSSSSRSGMRASVESLRRDSLSLDMPGGRR
ncbi:MAG: hypothetical protein Q9163_001050 [Psora crenata]